MTLTQPASSLVLSIYTVSFRKVAEAEEKSGPYTGEHLMSVPSLKMVKLAAGIYYYRLEGEAAAGGRAFSIREKFVILR